MMEWIKCSDRMPDKTEDNDGKFYYTFTYHEVRDDQWFSTYPRNDDGWGNKCRGGYFYQSNSSPEYGGEFKNETVTHWMEIPTTLLPEPPKE